ncbi:signal recognition particle protein [Buchnera aphidicola (Formosaphis micheliae)]|uniref:signal recognition particle protein n=1 Tax=Buchnera aphidicola TaxID=9 RepID=UPI0031CC8AC4
MFETLTKHMSKILDKISNQGRLTEQNIQTTLREIRIALLEADVAISVIQKIMSCIKEKSLGNKINTSLSPGQTFIKIVKNELINLMGKKNDKLNLNDIPPVIILFIGIQGVGKTTNLVKIGKWIQEKNKKKILTVSTDIYRSAAIKQLEILSTQANIDFFLSHCNQKPIDIVVKALEYAKLKLYDILLIDTAGRLHVDQKMMNEIKIIHNTIKPTETLFVLDSMTGQDSINIVSQFNQSIPITGIILTKVDSDARGGVALSARYITEKPIKFISTGEKIEALEPFHPERIASRILGMGDILSLIENLENRIEKDKSKKLNDEFNNKFNLDDFLKQIKQMKKIGGISNLVNKLPQYKSNDNISLHDHINDQLLNKFIAIINSMTKKERQNPEIIKGSHKRRISLGSGINIQDINKLLKQFNYLKKIMKKIKPNNMSKMLKNIKNINFKNLFN